MTKISANENMRIKLTKNDYDFIAYAISKDCYLNTDYVGCVRYTNELSSFDVYYTAVTQGYYEDDYFNGTGAFVCDYARVVVHEISVFETSFDSDNDDEVYKVEYDENEITNMAEIYLKSL